MDASDESDEAEVFVNGRAKKILPSIENRAEKREVILKEVANVNGKRANSTSEKKLECAKRKSEMRNITVVDVTESSSDSNEDEFFVGRNDDIWLPNSVNKTSQIINSIDSNEKKTSDDPLIVRDTELGNLKEILTNGII